MLVYYFVPFIVNNRYLLFWVSSGHNPVSVQNRTHVYMNFFLSQRPRKSPPAVMSTSCETPCISLRLIFWFIKANIWTRKSFMESNLNLWFQTQQLPVVLLYIVREHVIPLNTVKGVGKAVKHNNVFKLIYQ